MNSPEVNKVREPWIDWMKSITMLIVIWGHCFPEGLMSFIYAINVSVFFAISGYLTHPGPSGRMDWRKFLKTLIVPYLIFCLLKDAMFIISHIADGYGILSIGCILAGFHSFDLQDINIDGCNNLWYVFTLIIMKLVFHAIRYRGRSVAILTVLSLVLAVAYCHTSWFGTYRWGVINTFAAFPCFAFGWALGNTEKPSKAFGSFRTFIKAQSALMVSTITILAIAALWFTSDLNGPAFMYEGGYGNSILLFLLNMILGFAAIFGLSHMLGRAGTPTAIVLISTGTLAILCFHRDLAHPLLKLVTGMELPTVLENAGTFLVSVVVLLAFTPIIWLIQRYLPFLLGKPAKR